jgi:type VI secretion system Hcp family effector
VPARLTIGTFSAHGSRQGAIATDVPFVDFDWSAISPVDAGSGQSTGKTQHKPLALTMRADAASVLLLGALFTHENLQSVNPAAPGVQLAFVHQGGGPAYLTINLSNASVVSVRSFSEGGEAYEEMAFTYHTIAWTWVDGGTSTADDWTPPQQ